MNIMSRLLVHFFLSNEVLKSVFNVKCLERTCVYNMHPCRLHLLPYLYLGILPLSLSLPRVRAHLLAYVLSRSLFLVCACTQYIYI